MRGERWEADLADRAVALAASRFATPERVRDAVAARLEAGDPTPPRVVIDDLETAAGGAGRAADPDAVAAARRRLGSCGARVLVVGGPGYPTRLAHSWPELGAPLWLFARGPLPEGPAVAVVGTRRPTLDGLATARALGRLLADHGVVVVSGMARGIDQAAHRGALDGGGATVAVLGAGFDVDYPRGDGALRDAVAAAGGLLTEHLPGTPPRAPHFLWRNRVIAGLADATVVVEGRARSGALQTARLAAAQGREVLAVPGSLRAPASAAPLALLRDGATPVTRLDDVLAAIGFDGAAPRVQPTLDLPGVAGGPATGREPPAGGGSLPPASRRVLDLLGAMPATPGALAAASGVPVPVVLAAVADLTARGYARAAPGGVVRAHA